MAFQMKGGLADRYAAALFDLAEEQGELDRVAADLRSLRAMLVASPELKRLCASPVVGRPELGRAMAALAERGAMVALTAHFLGVLVRNGRLFALDATIGAFLARLAAKRGEVTASVASAQPLSVPQTEALAVALKRATGGAVALDATVDPGLLGGLVVQVGSRMVDGSLRTKMQRLSLAMKGIG